MCLPRGPVGRYQFYGHVGGKNCTRHLVESQILDKSKQKETMQDFN
jgi:hypothetical protein